MTAHKYVCGQPVSFTDRRVLAPGPASEFVIVKLLPLGDEAPRYEVQGSRETFTRVAEEASSRRSLLNRIYSGGHHNERPS